LLVGELDQERVFSISIEMLHDGSDLSSCQLRGREILEKSDHCE